MHHQQLMSQREDYARDSEKSGNRRDFVTKGEHHAGQAIQGVEVRGFLCTWQRDRPDTSLPSFLLGHSRGRRSLILILSRPDGSIRRAVLYQVGMPTGPRDAAILDDQDSLSPQNRGGAVGNNYQRSIFAKRLESSQQGSRSGRIEGARHLIDNQDPWPLQKSAGQRQTLSLTAGEACAERAERFVETLGKPAKDLIELSQDADPLKLRRGCRRIAIQQIFPHRVVK
jgi:hypothetical protein